MSGASAAAGYGDFHNHLVPGVDDGAPTMADALHSVDRMVAAGVRRIVATPHLPASLARTRFRFEAFAGLVEERGTALREAVARKHPGLDFRLGAELRLDTPEPDASDARTRLGGTSFVLVEWAGFRAPSEPRSVLEAIAGQGFRPVVAHPERYAGVDEGLESVRAWKDAGALLQGTWGSLVGQYGSRARMLVRRMLEEGLLDYLSSDFHGRPQYALHVESAADKLRRLGGGRQLDLLGKENPARLFSDQAPMPVPPLPAERPLAGAPDHAGAGPAERVFPRRPGGAAGPRGRKDPRLALATQRPTDSRTESTYNLSRVRHAGPRALRAGLRSEDGAVTALAAPPPKRISGQIPRQNVTGICQGGTAA